ncbi:MAG TPA: FHA domain-containing protein [Steroidobacteraceae bacterium]|nr:FHA domain-containing protein [Steroidobacteraceae bacterium]
MDKDSSRISELTAALEKAERRLVDRETLLNAALSQVETTRTQYEQAHERSEALRRRLGTKEEQIDALLTQLKASAADVATRNEQISALQRELERRDAEHEGVDEDGRHGLDAFSEKIAAMGLVLESLDEHGSQHKIESADTTLGRSVANDIRINSASVSRHHARIVVEVDAIYLIDLESTNGCSVNGRRITRHAITDGDVLSIGHAKFTFNCGLPMSNADDRSMDETFPLLNDSQILIPRPKSTSAPAQMSVEKPKRRES